MNCYVFFFPHIEKKQLSETKLTGIMIFSFEQGLGPTEWVVAQCFHFLIMYLHISSYGSKAKLAFRRSRCLSCHLILIYF